MGAPRPGIHPRRLDAGSGPGRGGEFWYSSGAPLDDPGEAGDPCFFSEKVETAQLLGYDAVIIAHHQTAALGGEGPAFYFCGGQGHEFEVQISAICVGHRPCTSCSTIQTQPATSPMRSRCRPSARSATPSPYFWGVEVIPNPADDPAVAGDEVLILASDRDYGLFIFRDA